MTTWSDDELRARMRALAQAGAHTLDDARIEAALPAYRGFLEAIEALEGVGLDPDEVPAHVFRLEQEGGE